MPLTRPPPPTTAAFLCTPFALCSLLFPSLPLSYHAPTLSGHALALSDLPAPAYVPPLHCPCSATEVPPQSSLAPSGPARHSTSAWTAPIREGGKGVAGFIPRAILAFLWNPLSDATPFKVKKRARCRCTLVALVTPRPSGCTQVASGIPSTAALSLAPIPCRCSTPAHTCARSLVLLPIPAAIGVPCCPLHPITVPFFPEPLTHIPPALCAPLAPLAARGAPICLPLERGGSRCCPRQCSEPRHAATNCAPGN